jgi:putative peptidoglycan lipid II flippase
MGGGILLAGRLFPYQPESAFSARAAWTGAMVALGIALYAATTTLLKCPEWTWIKGALSRGKKTEV